MSTIWVRSLAWTVVLALVCGLVTAEEWGRFRGPNGSGVGTARALPTQFSPDQHVAWKANVSFGRSSPVVSGRHIFLTGVEDGQLVVLALERKTGRLAWKRSVEPVRKPKVYNGTDSATPTPVIDGSNLYVLFPDAGVFAFNAEGAKLWQQDLGAYDSFYGLAGSPILAGEQLVVVCDQQNGSFLASFDLRSGKQRWRKKREGRFEAWTTPLLYPGTGNAKELVVFGSGWVDGYLLETGEKLWETSEAGVTPVSSPILAGKILIVNAPNQSGEMPVWKNFSAGLDIDGDDRLSVSEMEKHDWSGAFGWLDRDGDGFVARSEYEFLRDESNKPTWGATALDLGEAGRHRRPKMVWRYKKNLPYIPTPVVHDGIVYMVKEGGILSALDIETGKLHKRGRVHKSAGEVYASPIIAGGKLFIATLDGKVIVVQPGAQWEVSAVNDLEEEIHATPAVADSRLLVRTRERLYSFGPE